MWVHWLSRRPPGRWRIRKYVRSDAFWRTFLIQMPSVTGMLDTVALIYANWLRKGVPERYQLPEALLRRTWLVTLRKLRAVQPHKNTAMTTQIWRKLGAAHGLTERGVAAWMAQGNNAQPTPVDVPPWERCGWSGCMCYEQKALFRLAACTGCYTEYYCGEACQKK